MIIGIAGNLHCGKSTAASYIATNHGLAVHRFAGPIKKMGMCLGLTPQQVDGDLKETPCEILGGKTPRYFMQKLGTELGRKLIHPDLWLNAWVATMPKGFEGVVSDDVRFPNEAERIRSMGGTLIRIERTMEDQFERTHESEGQDLGKYDFIVDNNSTIEAMYATLDEVMGLIKERASNAD